MFVSAGQTKTDADVSTSDEGVKKIVLIFLP